MVNAIARIRVAQHHDVPALVVLEQEVWGQSAATAHVLEARMLNCPNGNLVAVLNDGKVCGFTSFCFLDYEKYQAAGRCTWYDLSGNGTASTHDPSALDLFGINLGVAQWAPKGTSTQLLAEVVKRGVQAGVRRGLLGARICGYHKRAHEMTAEEYAWAERNGLPLDPELRFYRQLGLRPVKLVENYFEDPESMNWGMIVAMANPFFRPAPMRLLGKALAVLPLNIAKVIDRLT